VSFERGNDFFCVNPDTELQGLLQQPYSVTEDNQDRQRTYSVKIRLVRTTIVVVESNNYYTY